MTDKIKCHEFQEKMTLHFAGELSQVDQADLEEHLKVCPECASLWEEYLQIRRGMDHLESLSEPSEWSQAVVRKAAQQKLTDRRKIKMGGGWRVLLSQPVVAAATVVLIIGVGIYSQVWLKREKAEVESIQPKKLEDSMVEPQLRETPSVPGEAAQEHPATSAKKLAPPPPAPEPAKAREGSAGFLKEDTQRDRKPSTVEADDAGETMGRGSPGGVFPQLAPSAPAPKAARTLEQLEPEAQLPQEEKLDSAVDGEKLKAPSQAKDEKPAPTPSPEPKKSEWDLIVERAKAKMNAGDFRGALVDFQKAQKMKDTPELQKWIRATQQELKKAK